MEFAYRDCIKSRKHKRECPIRLINFQPQICQLFRHITFPHQYTLPLHFRSLPLQENPLRFERLLKETENTAGVNLWAPISDTVFNPDFV
jgi:hypothetical protein